MKLFKTQFQLELLPPASHQGDASKSGINTDIERESCGKQAVYAKQTHFKAFFASGYRLIIGQYKPHSIAFVSVSAFVEILMRFQRFTNRTHTFPSLSKESGRIITKRCKKQKSTYKRIKYVNAYKEVLL